MKYFLKSQKYKGETLALFIIWAFICFILFLLIHISEKQNKDIDESIWAKEPSYVIHNHIIDLPIQTWTGRFNHVYHTWDAAELDSQVYLINPNPIQSNVLCNIALLPLLPNNKQLFSFYDSLEINNYGKNNAQFEVKKIPSRWISESKKEEIKEKCHDVDFSQEYIKYKNKNVVELLHVIQP